jgi:hypothetical protein
MCGEEVYPLLTKTKLRRISQSMTECLLDPLGTWTIITVACNQPGATNYGTLKLQTNLAENTVIAIDIFLLHNQARLAVRLIVSYYHYSKVWDLL